jgi:hypothetical protein
MARLNSVKGLTNTVIEFEGKRFEVTTEVPQKGDIARVDKAWGNQIEGKFYRVINEDHPLFTNDADKYVYIEGEVGKASDKIDAVTLFREVTEQPLKTEKRVAKPGERILVTNANPLSRKGQTYKNGDVFTVESNCIVFSDDVYVEGQPSFIDYKEYEVVVEAPTIKVGDKVRILNDKKGGLITFQSGREYKVTGLGTTHSWYDLELVSDAGVQGYTYADNVELVEESTPTFNVGDLIVVTNDNHEHREGDVLEIVNVQDESKYFDYQIRNLTTGRPTGFINKKNIRKATDEEVEATKPKPKAPFQPGDVVLVSEPGYEGYAEVLHGPDGIYSGGNYRVDFGTGEGQKIVLGDFMVMIAPKDNRVD